MTDTERVKNLRIFANIYNPNAEVEFMAHMPRESRDPDGSLFSEYFDMIQSIYAGRDTPGSEEHVSALLPVAKKFGYPLTQLRSLLLRKT